MGCSCPNRAVMLVVLFAVDGTTEVLARRFSRDMQDQLKQLGVTDSRTDFLYGEKGGLQKPVWARSRESTKSLG